MTMRPSRHVEIKHLHAFLVMAEELHFGRAAVRLGIAQPPLSQQIRRLEDAIGFRLLERDTRNVALTIAGQAFVHTARAVIEQLTVGIEQGREVASGVAGRLTIGFTASTALRLLSRIVPGFRTQHPRVGVELTEMMPDMLIETLTLGTIDLAILRDMTPDDRFQIMPLHKEPYVAVLPANHRLAAAPDFDLAEMADDAFILFPRDNVSQTNSTLYALCAEAGFMPRGIQEVPGWQTAIAMVSSGMGVTLLPGSVDCLNLPGVVYRRIASPILSTIVAVRRAGDDRPMVNAFLSNAERVAIP